MSRLSKADLPMNDALPEIEVDPETFTVRIDGERRRARAGRRAAHGPALLPLLTRVDTHPMTAMTAQLLLLLDSRSPAGAHSHSGGLEAAVGAGLVRDLADVDAFCAGRLRTAGVVAAGFRGVRR